MRILAKYRLATLALFVFILTFSLVPKINAESVSLEPTKDTYVDSANPTASYGTIGLGTVGYQPADSTRKAVLLHFDTSSLHPGYVIDSATLTLRLGGCIGTDASLGNMSFNAFLALGGSGWSNTSTFNQIGSSGGSLELFFSKIVPCVAGSYVDFDAKELTQYWVDGVIPNDGIVLNPQTSASNWTRVFYMKEATAASRPKLVINYTVPYEEVTSPDGGEIPASSETNTTKPTTVKAQSVPEPIAPDASLNPPTKLLASQIKDTNKIELAWDKSNSDNVELYRIYRIETGKEEVDKKIGEVQASDKQQFVDNTGENGKTYSYFIRSVRNNLESANSDIVTLKIENTLLTEAVATKAAKKDSQKNNLLVAAGLLLVGLSAALIFLVIRHMKLHKKHQEIIKTTSKDRSKHPSVTSSKPTG